MSSYELHPERVAGNTLVLIPNTLGGAALYTNGRTGDTVHRTKGIVRQLEEYGIAAGALAYDRIERTDLTPRTYVMGLRAADEASDYTRHCSLQARKLQATVGSLRTMRCCLIRPAYGNGHLSEWPLTGRYTSS